MSAPRPRLCLVHGPTPIVRRPALDALLSGVELWIKRDDATGGAESGNKLRKLELLLADARAKGATTVVTCGGIQSNHARATALACAALGLRAVLLLRVQDPDRARREPVDLAGNVLLDVMAGAQLRFVSPDEYAQRNALLERVKLELEESGEKAYVVPEGGSNGLGALAYVEAMREVREQMDLGLAFAEAARGEAFDVVAHACGSGGTAAGVALGAAHHRVAREAWAFAVCDDAESFEKRIAGIALEARGLQPDLPELAFAAPPSPAVRDDATAARTGAFAARLVVDDRAKGPAYAVMDEEQKRFLVEVTRASGIVLDPVYTGKALFGLAKAAKRGEIRRGARALFVHTGGLPGLLAQGEGLRDALGFGA
jgi:D-cysteine desulfhydrase